jgi:hypothetical protein
MKKGILKYGKALYVLLTTLAIILAIGAPETTPWGS